MAYTKGKLVVEGNSTTRTVTFTTKVVGPVGGEIVTEVSDPIALAAIAREILSALPKPEPVPQVDGTQATVAQEVKQ